MTMNKYHFNEHKQDTRKCDWLMGHIISIKKREGIVGSEREQQRSERRRSEIGGRHSEKCGEGEGFSCTMREGGRKSA